MGEGVCVAMPLGFSIGCTDCPSAVLYLSLVVPVGLAGESMFSLLFKRFILKLEAQRVTFGSP